MQVLCITYTYEFVYIPLLRVNKRLGKSYYKSCCVICFFSTWMFLLALQLECGRHFSCKQIQMKKDDERLSLITKLGCCIEAKVLSKKFIHVIVTISFFIWNFVILMFLSIEIVVLFLTKRN